MIAEGMEAKTDGRPRKQVQIREVETIERLVLCKRKRCAFMGATVILPAPKLETSSVAAVPWKSVGKRAGRS
jgi:hypothetical protein